VQPLPLLSADCAACSALCCTAMSLRKSADFAIDKPPDRPCPNLRADDFRCRIHDRLRDNGFPGCIAYDCFGAGQKVTQASFKGETWRSSPNVAGQMFEVFGVMQQLHSMLRYLTEAIALEPAGPLSAALQGRLDEIQGLSNGTPTDLMALDLKSLRIRTDDLLLRFSELVRRDP
jgi:hypothetical protein